MTAASSSNLADPAASGPRPLTLDEIFLRSVSRRPRSLALIDPPDRLRVTGHAPRRLTYAAADRAVSALAGRFIENGLSPGSVVAAQLPNTVEAILTILAALRAGLVIAMLPQLWRLSEMSDALNRTGAQAIVTMSSVDGVNHASLAVRAAAAAFPVKHVLAFGQDLPEGVTPLDEIFLESETIWSFPRQDARSAAIITFDAMREGCRVVPRTQIQLSAGGLAIMLQTHLSHGAPMLSTLMPSSFAGLCLSLITWLLNGCSLVLHQPFDADALVQQIAEENCSTLVAPTELLLRLNASGRLETLPSLRDTVGLWQTPDRARSAACWHGPQTLSDVYAFGEAGLVLARRGKDGAPAALFPQSPRAGQPQAASELLLTPNGTAGLRGPMVPVAAYAPKADGQGHRDHVDTGFSAQIDRRTGAIVIDAPPADVAGIGGYRFTLDDLARWASRLSQDTTLTAVPDEVSGFRLIGRSSDPTHTRAALTELGVNPLIVEAFRERSGRPS